MSINLCGGYIRVAQHFLDHAQGRPVGQQMTGEGMPQGVRRHIFPYAGLPHMFLDEFPDALPAERLPADRQEKGPGIGIRDLRRPRFAHIALYP